MAVRKEDVLAWLDALQQIYAENKKVLTDLDAAIGDADHGVNMDRGFTAVKAELGTNVPGDLQSILQAAATVLIRTIGGAAGPLYGTFFLRASMAATGKTELDAADVVAMFQAGIQGVQQRGKAVAGDKTMVDALMPALAAMRKSLEGGAGLAKILEEGAAAAEAGMRGWRRWRTPSNRRSCECFARRSKPAGKLESTCAFAASSPPTHLRRQF